LEFWWPFYALVVTLNFIGKGSSIRQKTPAKAAKREAGTTQQEEQR
jgi:hypothetical protein